MKRSEITDDHWAKFLLRANYLSSDYTEADFSAYSGDYIFYQKATSDNEHIEVLSIIECIFAGCLANRTFAKRLFDEKYMPITCDNVYNEAYWEFFNYRFETIYRPVISYSTQIFNSISLAKFIEYCDESEPIKVLSEWEIADFLFATSKRAACFCIDKMDTSDSTKSDLKKILLSNDYDHFVSTLIEKSVNFATASDICIILKTKDFLSRLSTIDDTTDQTVVLDIMEEPLKYDALNITLQPDEYDLFVQCHTPDKLSAYHFLPIMTRWIIFCILFIKEIKHLCPEVKLVSDFELFLSKHKFFYNYYVNETLANFDDDSRFRVDIPIFEDFKRRFIVEFELPQSTREPKGKKDCYDSDNAYCKLNEVAVRKLYERLVDLDFIEWDEQVAIAFMYRMCNSYNPGDVEIIPITWHGNISSLWTIISFFYKGTYKMDKLTRDFFLKEDGTPFREKEGGISQGQSKDQRVLDIKKEYEDYRSPLYRD